MARRANQLDGEPNAPSDETEALRKRAAELREDLVEPAKTTALEKLDEARQALSVAAAWVRRRLEHAQADYG